MAFAAAAAARRPGTRSIPSTISFTPPRPTQPVSLAKRLLFPHLPAGAELPPILASPSAPPEINAEINDFVALALRAFVNPWWSKITRYDKEFLPEIARILTHVIRELETRLTNTDLSPLIFRDLPTLVTQHYQDYRNAASKVSTSYATGGSASVSHLFHMLQPHMAITPEGDIHEDYIRQCVDHILKVCLPLEDYEPETERYIVREIIMKVILGSVAPKITQPWFINKVLLDLLGPSSRNPQIAEPPNQPPRRSTFSLHALSLQSLIVFFLSAVQSISGACLALINAYKHAVHTYKLVNQSTSSHHALPSKPALEVRSSSPSPSIGLTPPSSSPIGTPSPEAIPGGLAIPPSHPLFSRASEQHQYAASPIALLAEVLNTRERFASATLVGNLELITACATPFLDKLLPYILYTHVLSTERVTDIVRVAKRTLFPNGYLAAAPPDPTLEEQAVMREQLVNRTIERVPAALSPIILGPSPAARVATVNSALDPLSSQACNMHLFLFILDLILLTIFPELAGGTSAGAEPGTRRQPSADSLIGLGLGENASDEHLKPPTGRAVSTTSPGSFRS